MSTKKKVWDIVTPTDGWERNLALLSYLFLKVRTIGDARIEVNYV